MKSNQEVLLHRDRSTRLLWPWQNYAWQAPRAWRERSAAVQLQASKRCEIPTVHTAARWLSTTGENALCGTCEGLRSETKIRLVWASVVRFNTHRNTDHTTVRLQSHCVESEYYYQIYRCKYIFTLDRGCISQTSNSILATLGKGSGGKRTISEANRRQMVMFQNCDKSAIEIHRRAPTKTKPSLTA